MRHTHIENLHEGQVVDDVHGVPLNPSLQPRGGGRAPLSTTSNNWKSSGPPGCSCRPSPWSALRSLGPVRLLCPWAAVRLVATVSAGVAVFSATRRRGRHAASCQPPGSTIWSPKRSNINLSEPVLFFLLRSFVPSFLRSFVPSFLRSFVPSFLRGSFFVLRGSWFVVHSSWLVLRGSCFVARASWLVLRGSFFVARGSWLVARAESLGSQTPGGSGNPRSPRALPAVSVRDLKNFPDGRDSTPKRSPKNGLKTPKTSLKSHRI